MLSRQIGCVYRATNRETGRAYIGKTIYDLAKRRRAHIHSAKRGGGCWYFGSALLKYGADAFDWAEVYLSADNEALKAAEILIIGYARASGAKLYNLTDGGDGRSGPYSRAARRAAQLPEAQVTRSPSHRAAIGAALRGRKIPWTAERLALHKAAQAKRKEKSDAAYRQKLSEIHRHMWTDPAYRERMVASRRARATRGRA